MNKYDIKKLISLKQEGNYWDFKREWYFQDKKADLLHDIICMANNLVNRDAYIIIGVDEENDYSFSSVKSDPNRKNTQQLVDFLREKHFAGGVRPIVSVENISFGENEIDVIVIHALFCYLIRNALAPWLSIDTLIMLSSQLYWVPLHSSVTFVTES